jgi:hypothetical protein
MGRFPGREIGPIEICVGDSYAAAALVGRTQGPANLTFEESTAVSRLNVTGLTTRSKVITGVSCMLTATFGEATIAALASLTGQAADTGETRLALKSRVGTDLRANAQCVVAKPILTGGVLDTDATHWFVIPAGMISMKINAELSVEGQTLWAAEIEGAPLTAEEVDSGGRLAGEGFEEFDVLVLGA